TINIFNGKGIKSLIRQLHHLGIRRFEEGSISPFPFAGSTRFFTGINADAQPALREKKAQGQFGNKQEQEKKRHCFFGENIPPEEKGKGQNQSRSDEFQRGIPREAIQYRWDSRWDEKNPIGKQNGEDCQAACSNLLRFFFPGD